MRHFLIISLSVLCLGSCVHFNRGQKDVSRSEISEAEASVQMFRNHSVGMKKFFASSYGYAIFPSVGKLAYGVGGAHGEGLVYRSGNLYGFSAMSQLTVGLQIGGQVYSEIIFFENQAALDRFTNGNFELDAQASGVVLTSSVSANFSYRNGVAIFTIAKGGLMVEASVGGQKFSFQHLAR